MDVAADWKLDLRYFMIPPKMENTLDKEEVATAPVTIQGVPEQTV